MGACVFCLCLFFDIIAGKRVENVRSVIIPDGAADTFANGNRQNFLRLKRPSTPNNCRRFNGIILFCEFN